MNDIKQRLMCLFPFFNTLPDALMIDIIAGSRVIHPLAGTMMLDLGKSCDHIPLVLSGVLRVYRLSSLGREVTLYRVEKGEVCLFSLATTMGWDEIPVIAEVDEDAEIFMIPLPLYQEALAKHPPFKDYMLLELYRRLKECLQVLEGVAFGRMDRRLCQYLDGLCGGKPITLSVTHEKIAAELGTAREVVTRLLGNLRDQGILMLSRGNIRILSPEQIHDLSQ